MFVGPWRAMLSPASQPYLGVVATRGLVANNSLTQTTGTTLMSRSMNWARDTLSRVAIIVPNFLVDVNGATFTEIGLGSAATVTASIEYPSGTFTQVKFSGSASGTVPNAGYLVSDFASVAIPKGAQFWVRMYNVNASGFLLNGFGNDASTVNGEFCNLFDGDRTMSGTVDSQFAGFTLAPLAVIGMTRLPSFLLVGTSRVEGIHDNQDSSGDVGIMARSIGPSYGYINAGIASDNVAHFLASHTNRVALAQYVSHVICEGPTNDGCRRGVGRK